MKFQQIAAKEVIGAAAACTVGAIVSAAAPASALVAQWDFNTPGSTPFTASNVDPNVTSTQLSAFGRSPAGITSGTTLLYQGATGAVDAATALSSNSYLTFAVTPQAGVVMNLSNITFTARNVSINTGQLALISNLTGNTNLIDGVKSITQIRANNPLGSYTFNLSTLPTFQNVTAPVRFTILAFAPQRADNLQNIYDIDNIALNGTVAPVATGVPFPFAPLPGIALTWGVSKVRRKLQAKQTMKATVNA